MFCDVCKTAKASVFLTQIVEGKMQKVNLCEACSQERGVGDPTAFALADLLQGLGAAQEVERAGGEALRCGACGFTQAEFKKTGRLGCSECYSVFSEGLESLLRGMHKGLEHRGKVPERQARRLEQERELRGLHEKLREAVGKELYEEAALLRDQIRQLEGRN
ncbi:MAG: hypothetical protein RLZZ244_2891 [Verrucomicrobiota bacterium]|jgi:protein arginine kinase activator